MAKMMIERQGREMKMKLKKWTTMGFFLCMGGKLPSQQQGTIASHQQDQSHHQNREWWSLFMEDDDEIIALNDWNEQILLGGDKNSVSLGSWLKRPPNPSCRILFWSASKGLVCTVGSLDHKLPHDILVFNPLTGSSRRLPLPPTLSSEVLGMVMTRSEQAYQVIIFDSFYIHTYSSKLGDWATTLAEHSFRPSTGVVASGSSLVCYACESETQVLSVYDWKLVRRVRPPFESVQVDERCISIANNLMDFRGRCLTLSGLRMGSQREDCVAVWELNREVAQDKRIKSPWVLWRCVPYHLLKEFVEKPGQGKSLRLETFFTGRLIGAWISGRPELGGLAYDTKLDAWNLVSERAFDIPETPLPPLLCFQSDLGALP